MLQKDQEVLKCNGTHRLLVYTDFNILDESINNIKKNKETPMDSSRMADLGGKKKTKKTKNTRAVHI
jgi:hypothetical protein